MSGDTPVVKAFESYALTRWLFLRLLGLVYVIAFLSLAVQVKGLIGINGISPAQVFLANVGKASIGFFQVPTIAWINSSDTFLQLIPLAGAFFGLLVSVGVATPVSLAVCWFLYLSIMTIGGDFLMFQWDSLLLETGFLAIFFAPWQLLERKVSQPPRVILFLIRLLLFRLLFGSGMCKIVSGDQTWHDLTALTYHYETQPLPTPLAWFGNQLPLWFQKFSCGIVFLEELIVPFLVFAPYQLRLIGAALMFFLQFMIAATGNYAFFNLLTVVLIFSLLDDAVVRRLIPKFILRHLDVEIDKKPAKAHAIAANCCLALIITIIFCQSVRRTDTFLQVPTTQFLAAIAPLQLFNSYGLFAIMTTSRPEIIIEGSDDGNTWQEYEFYFKPGDLKAPPPIVAPYQPRLDWQMWFAALSDEQSNPWFTSLIRRLLDGSPDVLALIKTNPFPNKPPRYARALLYDYRFTNSEQQKATGAWWHRVAKGVYFPIATLGSN